MRLFSTRIDNERGFQTFKRWLKDEDGRRTGEFKDWLKFRWGDLDYS